MQNQINANIINADANCSNAAFQQNTEKQKKTDTNVESHILCWDPS